MVKKTKKTLDEVILAKPGIRRLMTEFAVDHCWGIIRSNSVKRCIEDVVWMDLGDDLTNFKDEVLLLWELGLLERRPGEQTQVREIASL